MPPIDRKRKIHKTNAKAVDAISFDPEARQEYLSGFHKRKVQRAEHGRNVAEKRMKEATVQARKEVRIRLRLRCWKIRKRKLTKLRDNR